MSTGISITFDQQKIDRILDVTNPANRRRMFAGVGGAVRKTLKSHFLGVKSRGKGFGGYRRTSTGFWSEISESVVLESFDENHATVAVKDRRANPHIFGAVIKPINADMLALPIRAEVDGIPAREGVPQHKLYPIKGRNYAFLGKHMTVGNTKRSVLYYILLPEVTIPKNPDAKPDAEKITSEVHARVDSFLQRQIKE